MGFLSVLKGWFLTSSPPALSTMRLAPLGREGNPLMIQFFTWDCLHPEMSWWRHLEAELPRLADLGITQIWLPPPNKAAEIGGRGYDAYDLWDLGEFDQKGTVGTRWGTKEELLQAIRVAKQHGIDILIDAVLNHKLGADRIETFPAVLVDPNNRLKEVGHVKNIEGWTAFDYEGRAGKYSSLRWTYDHFTGLDWDQKTRQNGIFRIVSPTKKYGKGWSKNVDSELGNYDYLLGIDIDHRDPAVRADLLNWGSWVLETTGATGWRLDAIKHFDHKFLLEFLIETRRRSKVPNVFAVAEYWSGDLKLIQPYIRMFKGQTAFFDVPLHMNFNNASNMRSRYDLRTILDNTILKTRPGDAVTFVDNHDTVEGKSLESWVGTAFKTQAYALILLRGDGHPCVFYGDLYPNRECYDEGTARNLELLMKARSIFAHGNSKDYFAEHNCIGFVRLGTSEGTGCAVVLSNKDDTNNYTHSIRMNLGARNAGRTFISFMTSNGRVEIDKDGWGDFSCFANSVQVWVPSK